MDTVKEMVRVPLANINEVKTKLIEFLGRKKVRLKELQHLFGLLAFCARAMPSARAFSRRLYGLLKGAKEPHHFIRLARAHKEDLEVWLRFFNEFKSNINFLARNWVSNTDMELFTDSAGNAQLGWGAVLGNQWTYLKWPVEWSNSPIIKDITFLELVPIAIALCVWKEQFRDRR